MALVLNTQADAYSYSASGKEPLIDGRNGIVGGLAVNDYAKVDKYFQTMREDVEFLGNKYDETLLVEFEKAIAGQKNTTIMALIHRLFAAEIQRRLSVASHNLRNYQGVKVMVTKSIRFFDVISPELPKPVANAAHIALQACLKAIGKPGVFGAGKTSADPDAYKQALADVVKAFAQ